jgi:hypothetical protein
MLKIASLTTGLLAAGLFLTPLSASAAQIGVAAVPGPTTGIETVQYGYGRPHYGRRFYGGRGYGYGGRFHGGPRFGRGYGYGRGYGRGHGYGFGRRGFY